MTDSESTLIILGGTGDLASRLLLPGVGKLLTVEPERRLTLLGSGRKQWSDDRWRRTVSEAFSTVDAEGPAVEHALSRSRYISADVSSSEELGELAGEADGRPIIYFALPPSVTATAVKALHNAPLPEDTMLALEKPFGSDRKSAAELNELVAGVVPESRTFRVDHFMGESTVLNILGLRLANRVFEPLWNREHIARVEIVYDEQLGLEGRGGYYDKAGAMVDMIQSHLLQIMALIVMEPPAELDAGDLHAAKVQALRSMHLWGDDPRTASRRARYTAGTVSGRHLPSYAEEDGVEPERRTETLAEVDVEAANWRWAGVPFTLRSGKALGQPRQEVILHFRKVPHLPGRLRGTDRPNVLRLNLDDGGVDLGLNVNGAGNPLDLEQVHVAADVDPGALNPYGQVLRAMLNEDRMLALDGAAAEQGWRIVDQVRDAWKADEVPLDEYEAGSSGPQWPRKHQ
jgi:glucose-6-phosphate 1-dehydrogenase